MASKTTVPTPSRRKRAAAPAPAPVEPAPAAGGLPSTEELLRAGLKAFRLENLLGLGQHAKAPRAEAPAPGLGFPSLDSFGFRKAGEIIALVNGDESKLPDLLKWWAAQTADWMDAWASDRQFAASDEDIEELGED